MVYKGRRPYLNMRRISSSRAVKLIMVMVLCISLLTGCEKKNIILTTGFAPDELMRINTLSVYRPEMMLYLTTIQNRYEEVYGSDVWEHTYEGKTIEERVKDMVLAKLAQIKVMDLMADSYGLSLDESEEAKVLETASSFFNSLSDKEKAALNVTEEDIAGYYRDYALSEKVYDYVIRDINPEISDDEARTVTVLQILIKTYATGENGRRIEYSERAKEEAKELADEVYSLAVSGNDSFEALAAKYNEGDEVTYSFMQGEMAESFEKVAFSLDKDEICEPVETEYGFHIMKCISDFDVEETQRNKEKLLKERKKEVFDKTYDDYLSTLTKILNDKLYDSIVMIHDEDVTTTSFFDVDF